MEGKFGRLVRLSARTGWAHEARQFTPWLAQNLDYLGQELGLALELRETEHPVGRYSLDMLLSDAEGRVVIVENQFEQTNHDHLGKLLTYCAGTNADLVIWIAEALTEEHVAALEWLNSKTVDGVGFFGVELELLHIEGGDQMAPHFRVVVRPNEWTKRARREAARASTWDWERYSQEGRVPPANLEIGRKLVDAIDSAIAERELPWQKKFNPKHISYQRAGGYNVIIVDFGWSPRTNFRVNLPGHPTELGIESPYPGLETIWVASQRGWGWVVTDPEDIPDVAAAVDMARRFQPASGPMVGQQGPGPDFGGSESSL